MIDTNAAIRTWLTQDGPLSNEIGDRVACPDLPEGANPAADSGGEWVTFRTRGGRADLYTPVIAPSVQVTTWAKTAARARAIYGLVFDKIHGAEMIDLGPAGFVLSAYEEVQGQDVTDPDTGWATVVTFFSVKMRSA